MVKVLTYLLLLAPVAAFRNGINNRRGMSSLRMSADEYTVAILGDLHLDPRYMEDHYTGREHFLKILDDGKLPNSCVEDMLQMILPDTILDRDVDILDYTDGNVIRETGVLI